MMICILDILYTLILSTTLHSYDLHNLLVEFHFVVSLIWSMIVYVVVPWPDDDLYGYLVFINLIHHTT